MRSDNQRLRVMVADHANTFVALQLWQIGFEFGSEIIIFDIMDRSGEIICVMYRETPSFGSEV